MNVGIIGCGSIAKFRHAPEYQMNPYVKEIVFYDRNPERASALAEKFDGRTVETLEALFSDASIQAISDCTSNEQHHIFSTKALNYGKHVLCEKPIALTIGDAEEMIQAQKQSDKILMIAHNQRFAKGHEKAKEIIQSGELGSVLTFRTTLGHNGPESWGVTKSNATWFFKKERSGLGVAGDLGIHKVDLIQYLLDDQICKVQAFQGTLDKVDEAGEPIKVSDNIVCNLKTNRGVLGTASFSWTYYGEEDNSTVIYCEQGIMRMYHHPTYSLEVQKKDGQRILYEQDAIQTNDNQTNTGVVDAFIDSVRFERQPPVTGEDALSALKVVLSILESAETEKTVDVI